VKRYQPKDAPRPTEEEFSHIRGYKQMLSEVGFLAGQHEVLSDAFCKERYKGVMGEVKSLKEARKKNMKEAEKIAAELKAAYKKMDAHKEKFRKAFDDQEKSTAAYNKANDDGNVTRNEVAKMSMSARKTAQACEAAKGQYASQLVKTNDSQKKYYQDSLPRLLDGLQRNEEQRIEVLRSSVMSCVSKEQEVSPIIAKCHDTIASAMHSIDPSKDTRILIERYKSGDVPPADFKFEDMSDPQAMLAQDALEKPTNLNLYQRKREIEGEIKVAEVNLAKKQKELASMQQMVQTYKQNPKFGNAKQFAGEIGKLNTVIGEIEAALGAMRADLSNIERQLDSLQSRSPRFGGSTRVTERQQVGQNGSRVGSGSSHSSGSLKSLKSLSISSQHSGGATNISPDSGVNAYNDDNYDEWDSYEPAPPPPPPPPPAPPMPNGGNGQQCQALRTQAIYEYSGDKLQDSNIPMAEGEILEVVEEDTDGSGWTRVRRLEDRGFADGGEGYVPTSFLKMV